MKTSFFVQSDLVEMIREHHTFITDGMTSLKQMETCGRTYN